MQYWTVIWRDKNDGSMGMSSSPFSKIEWAIQEAQNPPRTRLEPAYIEGTDGTRLLLMWAPFRAGEN